VNAGEERGARADVTQGDRDHGLARAEALEEMGPEAAMHRGERPDAQGEQRPVDAMS
jgi:hypothetical protein